MAAETSMHRTSGDSRCAQKAILSVMVGLSSLALVSSLGDNVAWGLSNSGQLPCENLTEYYSPASNLEGSQLKTALHNIISNHKSFSYAQVWDSLKILDAADEFTPEVSPEVIEIYSRKRIGKDLAASPEGWNREHLWPRSYGLVMGQPQFTDLQNLRPVDVNVNSARGNKLYGDCSTQSDASCQVPANREAAPDTATNRHIWMPPKEVRGDIARSLMYMAVRYDGEEPNSVDLELSDEPDRVAGKMGMLSTLLEWHVADPPSPSEQLRNSRVCSLFQHNRNPFVDHPDYASLIWGKRSPLASVGFNIQQLAAPLSTSWINEIHYSNQGPDRNEFIEVVVGPNSDPSELYVYLYNGKDGSVYNRIPVSSFSRGQSYGLSLYNIYAKYIQTGIQNGPRDGIALVAEMKASNGQEVRTRVLDFLSYGGPLIAREGPAMGMASYDIGVTEGNNAAEGGSLGLSGNLFGPVWKASKTSTFGYQNIDQTI